MQSLLKLLIRLTKMLQQKQHVTRIQEQNLANYRDGQEVHGFVSVQEATLKDGNHYTGKTSQQLVDSEKNVWM